MSGGPGNGSVQLRTGARVRQDFGWNGQLVL